MRKLVPVFEIGAVSVVPDGTGGAPVQPFNRLNGPRVMLYVPPGEESPQEGGKHAFFGKLSIQAYPSELRHS